MPEDPTVYRLTVKVEIRQGSTWVDKWSDVTVCSDVKIGASTTVHNGDKDSRRYEINVECGSTPG